MVTLDDVAGAVKTRLDATSGFSAAVPGGAYYDRGPDTPSDYPYVVFTVTAEDPMVTLESVYFQSFIVNAVAYCPIGDASTNVQTVEQVLANALYSDAAGTAFEAAALRNASERFMDAEPVIPSGEYAEPQVSARDVFAAGVQSRIMVTGDRSVV